MKTTKEIAADCGLQGNEAALLETILSSEKGEWPETSEIIGALYRRIEALEEEKALQSKPPVRDFQ